ncbi:biorientation of chromosomes in cell division protein 1-like 1 [Macrobrachium nipponense]|uniref:biorientation of chromosomes in cell division protein 1-like 1 n=1 Tax=Macrobrachium nipponense TaxID=159736 RepID=UPI0030C7AA1D
MSILVNKELTMDIPVTQLPPGDPRLVEAIVGQLKSKGIFDQFRKECLADVDTKPAFQNLRQRVEGQVNKFLEKKIWKNDLNKNQLRDGVRKHVNNLGILDSGIDAIITQVVNPKIKPLILPYVEDTVYAFLQIDKPKRERKTSEPHVSPLLLDEEPQPTLLEPIDVKKPSLLPMETDVISSEEDDILARESPDGDSKSSCSSEAEEVKTMDENAQDGFENCPPCPEESPDAIAANVERLQLSEDDSKSVQATKPPLPLFDDQSLDSISSNSSGLTFSPLTVKGSPESKKSDDAGKGDGSPRAEMRSATSTPLVDEKPVDESSQSSVGSNHAKEYVASEKHQGDSVPPEDRETSTPSLSALQPSARSGKEGTSLMSFDEEDSLESKGSSKASLVSGKSEIEEKIKSDKSEGEITSSSSDFSDGDVKGKQDHISGEGKLILDHDSSHRSSKSKSDHKKRRDSHSRDRDREREKEKESRHHRDKERKHSKSRDDHHSHRDKDKKHHRRDKDHDGDRDRSRSHHHQSSSSSSHKDSSGTKDKDRSSYHSGGKSSEGKSRSSHSSDKSSDKSDRSSSKTRKSDEKMDGKSHRKDEKHSHSSSKKSDERSDKRLEKVDKKSEKKECSVERQKVKGEGKSEGKKEKAKEKGESSSRSGSESSLKENRENTIDKDLKKHRRRHDSTTTDVNSGDDERADRNDKSCSNNSKKNGVCENLDENCTIDPHMLGLTGDNIIVADDEGNFMLLTYDTDTDSMASENHVTTKADDDSMSETATGSVDEDSVNYFEGFENAKPKTKLTDYLLNSVVIPDEMDMECNEWFDESDLHLTIYENAWDGKVPLNDFLSCMHRLGAVIRNDKGEVEDHSRSGPTYMPVPDIKENNNIQPIGKKRRISNSSSISSSSSSTGSPKHKRFRRESSTTSDTSQTLEQGAVIVSGYALLTPEDDGNRSMSREYDLDYSQKIANYSPLSPASDSSADEGKLKTRGAVVDSSNNIVKPTSKINQKTDTSWPSKEAKFSA